MYAGAVSKERMVRSSGWLREARMKRAASSTTVPAEEAAYCG